MGNSVIAINREYGAGGRTLAALLSEKLGIPWFEKDFVMKTVEESGYEKEEVERSGEELSVAGKVLDDFLNSAVTYQSSHDAIFEAEKKVVLELAEKPCIIVGRCAGQILQENGKDVISILLRAPIEHRLKRAAELAENGGEKLEKFVEERDKRRNTFCKLHTGREITDSSIYTMCFDVSKVSIPTCAEIIEKVVKERDNEA